MKTLKNLPKLQPNADADETHAHMMTLPKTQRTRVHFMSPGPDRWKERSRTFTGIGAAMAAQWGGLGE